MNKYLTIAILTILAGTAQASYTYNLPLQSINSKSGALPEGSIRFVKAGDGTGLPPTPIVVVPPIVEGGSGETEFSEEQSCLTEHNSISAKAQIEDYPDATFGGLFFNASSEKKCIAHAYLARKSFDETCKVKNANKLNIILNNLNQNVFHLTYEFTGGC
ncbi:hypothetical protein EJ576_21970 [Pseudomonas sp. C 49-2]|uniref:hypothetical protein n=1 Tax=Pseudomonas sp. C 49-2 TaxID=2496849 RepID=UPI000F83A63B|nr:hypothetical protein [Pseudomonas sp. C 49-2]RTX96396.1 hypothetical protein EJ576_21970 [Pseudomonas sp. C 49-2]